MQSLPQLQLRPMVDDDLAEVMRIEQASYDFPWTLGIFGDCLRVGYICRVLEFDVHIVGYGVMSVGAGEAHILNVCIDERYRCRGLARVLLHEMLRSAAALGAQAAYLEVRPSNLAAIRLYAALGFEQVGTRRGYYQARNGREDAALLRIDLPIGQTAATRRTAPPVGENF